MTEDVKLNARVAVEGPFKVGSTHNALSVTIENAGPRLSQIKPHRQYLYLDSLLGSDDKALFNNRGDVNAVTVTLPALWNAEWTIDETRARLRIFIDSLVFMDTGKSLEIKLTDVISKTAPGNAALTFSTSFQADKVVELPIAKSADNPGIIHFTSDPPEGAPNLPEEKVTLKWLTYKLTSCELTQAGSSDPLPYHQVIQDRQTNMIAGEKGIVCGSSDMSYTLTGYDGSKRFERTLQVRVTGDGWQRARPNRLSHGDLGDPALDPFLSGAESSTYPIDLQPTVLFNANNVFLYAVFRHDFQGWERALLFRTRNPLGDWYLVESGVDGQQGLRIPKDHATSPGVYADDKLWLVGGSQVDPEKVSNEIWYCDARSDSGSTRWKRLPNAPWPARMGHAVLKFGNEIWIMGGRDGAGNTLNDVSAMDLKSLKWREVGDAEEKEEKEKKEKWPARCLFHPAVFDEKIWLFGGAAEPFAETLYDDLWVFDGNQWKKKPTQGLTGPGSMNFIAAGLQEFQGKLILIGQYRKQATDTSEVIETLASFLESVSANVWKGFPKEKLTGWGAGTTFNLQLLNFGQRMLVANALAYEPLEQALQVYVK